MIMKQLFFFGEGGENLSNEKGHESKWDSIKIQYYPNTPGT